MMTVRFEKFVLGALLISACQDVPSGGFDPFGGPQRGPTPPPDSVVGGAGGAGGDPTSNPADGGGGAIVEVQVDAGSADAVPVVDAAPVVEAAPPIEAAPVVSLPACRASMPGEIDLWIGGQGNCSYPIPALPEFTASVDRELYNNGATCGSCLEVSSDRGSVIATVVDQYPVAPTSHGNKISLGSAALAKVAAPGTSIAQLRWRWVPCPAVGSIQGALKEGSGQFYWEVMIRNATNRVVRVESMVKTEKTWRPAKQEAYGYFSNANGNGLPVQLRLTDTEGNTVTTGNLTWPANVTDPISLGVQFPAACMP